MEGDNVGYLDIFDEISCNDIKEFWLDRNVKSDCELCGTDKWLVHISPAGAIPVISYKKIHDVANNNNFHPLLIVSCSNCGNIRNINRTIIAKWKFSKKDGDGDV